MTEPSDVKLTPREMVVLVDDFDATVSWYVDVLGFRVTARFTEEYRYANLETESGIRIGIAPAAEMGVEPTDRANNNVILQMGTPDVKALLCRVQENGGVILFGPSFDQGGGFWYGAFADLEGNPIWVVDENCP